jgi:hypothetical protein
MYLRARALQVRNKVEAARMTAIAGPPPNVVVAR